MKYDIPTGKDFPYKYFPALNQNPRALVIFLSGAGGWLPFANQLSNELAIAGIDVFGFNSLRYFFYRHRTPEELARDLETKIETWLKTTPQRNIILVGYSQGADVLPFALSRLEDNLRKNVKLLVLIGPAKKADFTIRLQDLVTGGYSLNALDTYKEITKIHDISILCLHGKKDRSTLCHELNAARFECQELPGGHMCLINWKPVANLLLKKIDMELNKQG